MPGFRQLQNKNYSENISKQLLAEKSSEEKLWKVKKKRAADCVLSYDRVSLIRNKNNICFVLGCRTKSSKLVSTRKNAQSSKRYVVVKTLTDNFAIIINVFAKLTLINNLGYFSNIDMTSYLISKRRFFYSYAPSRLSLHGINFRSCSFP